MNQYMQTSLPKVFACGNVLHVNDLVDNVSAESERAGLYAALFAKGKLPAAERIVNCLPNGNVRYICPQTVVLPSKAEAVALFFRVPEPDSDVTLQLINNGRVIKSQKAIRVNPVSGQTRTAPSGPRRRPDRRTNSWAFRRTVTGTTGRERIFT